MKRRLSLGTFSLDLQLTNEVEDGEQRALAEEKMPVAVVEGGGGVPTNDSFSAFRHWNDGNDGNSLKYYGPCAAA